MTLCLHKHMYELIFSLLDFFTLSQDSNYQTYPTPKMENIPVSLNTLSVYKLPWVEPCTVHNKRPVSCPCQRFDICDTSTR